MSFRLGLFAALSSAFLGSTAASAALIAVTSYEMNNGNGAAQFTGPTGGQNYFDFTYTQTGQSTPHVNAGRNGSGDNMIPTASNSNAAPLSGGTGLLTNNVIPTANYSEVSGISSGQYVGWKYQDPTILFHLATGQSVSQIQLFVASNNSGGLVGAPQNVTVTTINSQTNQSTLVAATMTAAAYQNSPFTTVITLTLDQPLSSDLDFSLQLFRGPLLADGRQYYADHVQGYDPANPAASSCVGFCDPDPAPWADPKVVSGFREYAAGGIFGPLPDGPVGLEPWIMVSEVRFLSAVPEPSTWMMMIAGFAGLGYMAMRRKRSALAASPV